MALDTYNSNPYTSQLAPKSSSFWQQYKRPLIVSLVILAVLAGILSKLLLPNVNVQYADYALHPAGTTSESNFSTLKDNGLLSYNGLGFFKYDTTSKQTTTLSSGLKLPQPASVYWAGDQGALMQFTSAFGSSEIDRQLIPRNIGIAEYKQYLWYMDFASNSLKLVGKQSISNNGAVYSPSANGFYYVPAAPENDDAAFTNQARELRFYSITNSTDRRVSNNVRLTDVLHVSSCPKNIGIACLVGYDGSENSQKLLAINEDGTPRQLIDSKGRIFISNNPSLYVVAANDTTPQTHENETVDALSLPAELYNIADDTSVALGIRIGSEQPIFGFENNGSFYILNNATEELKNTRLQYTVGKIVNKKAYTKTTDLTLSPNGRPSSRLISSVGYGNNGQALVTTINDKQFIFSHRNPSINLDEPKAELVQASVSQCAATSAKDKQYFDNDRLYKIYFVDDASLSSNIQAFTNCIIQAQPTIFNGYSFYFGTLSPKNGRITSD
jgi:hypothetical protein